MTAPLIAIYQVFVVTALLFSSALSNNVINCPAWNVNSGKHFDQNVKFDSNAALAKVFIIHYNRKNMKISTFEGVDLVNVSVTDVNIIVPDDTGMNKSGNFNTHILNLKNLHLMGFAKLQRIHRTKSIISHCHFFFKENSQYRNIVSSQETSEIIRQAASCINDQLCSQLGTVNLEDLANEQSYNVGPLTLLTRKVRDNTAESSEETDPLQEVINAIADISIKVLVVELDKIYPLGVDIPDLVTKYLSTWNGTVTGLTELQRCGDFKLSQNDMELKLDGALRVPAFSLNYKKYKFKYFKGSSKGANIKVCGLTLSASVLLNYNLKPCTVSLYDLNVVDYGNIQLHISRNIVNKILSSMLTDVGQIWKKKITNKLVKIVKSGVNDALIQFNCEQFRPYH